ncbi:hypothetical protein [Amnibacterium setariae]|uniref:Uncharacterized protein n=1 Tax=Amnibacterium setariae TaxID=2306585 RepID=A0A3A1U2P0_9MICO|nr:hypothetical protein [Amnibacterium setariae]RIX28127.1 hypothetical protein D1781_11635 [Amnibacterium setariae]
MSWSSPEERERRLRRARLANRIAIGAFAVALVALVVLLVLDGPSPMLLLAGLLVVVSTVRTALRLRAIGRALAVPPEG